MFMSYRDVDLFFHFQTFNNYYREIFKNWLVNYYTVSKKVSLSLSSQYFIMNYTENVNNNIDKRK